MYFNNFFKFNVQMNKFFCNFNFFIIVFVKKDYNLRIRIMYLKKNILLLIWQIVNEELIDNLKYMGR